VKYIIQHKILINDTKNLINGKLNFHLSRKTFKNNNGRQRTLDYMISTILPLGICR